MNSPLEMTDFSKGKTDNYLAGPGNAGQEFENLLIDNNKKAFSRQGSIIRDSTNFQVPSGVKRIGYIIDHRDQLIDQTERHLYYISGGLYNELIGPSSNPALGIGTEANHVSVTSFANQSLIVSDSFCDPIKIYKDGSNVLQVRTAGMPTIAAPIVTKGGAGAVSYIYAFLYYYTYVVEGVTFEDFGPTVEVSISSSDLPSSASVAITNIPVITNGGTGNYDTANIKVKIYRTEVNLTTLKFIGQVTNGTTTYTDSATDASITNNVVIYTTGDVVDNDPPPPAKFVHVAANNIALYGYVKESGVQVPNRIRQSIQGDFDACPASFFDDLPEDIYGINSIQSTFIVFCKESVYRVDGVFDEQGRGGLVHLRISETVGCVSNDSIIQTDDGLFFAAKEGFYFCDGYKVQKISQHLNTTYQTLVTTTTQSRNIFAAFDKDERRIWWACQADTSSLDNDSCFILDLTWGVSDECSFTTAVNGTSFRPTCLLFKNDKMYRGDTRGYVFAHDSTLYTDPKVDATKVPSLWNRVTIVYDYKSCAFNFGTSFVRKFVPTLLLTLANRTNIAVQPISINDDGKKVSNLREIRYNSNITWGDPNIIWGDPLIIWNKVGLIEEKRMFPAKGLRCNYKQIEITNSNTAIINSDLIGTCTVDASAKTATLNTAGSTWPADSVDYFLSFVSDGYVNQFLITSVTSSNVLTFSDVTNLCPATGSYKWLLKGLRKDEAIKMLSYVVHYKILTPSQKAFHASSDTGSNA